MSCKLTAAETSGEESTLIHHFLQLDKDNPWNFRFVKDQAITSTLGIGTTNRPPHLRIPAIVAMISSLMFHGKIKR